VTKETNINQTKEGIIGHGHTPAKQRVNKWTGRGGTRKHRSKNMSLNIDNTKNNSRTGWNAWKGNSWTRKEGHSFVATSLKVATFAHKVCHTRELGMSSCLRRTPMPIRGIVHIALLLQEMRWYIKSLKAKAIVIVETCVPTARRS
jgi:hypothetical protein